MKTIGARLTTYYAVAATVTAAILFFAGYILLENRLISGLDQLNAAEFRQLKMRLGSDYASLSPPVIDRRIRETADAAAALFFIDVDEPRSGMVFYSGNLQHRSIPDIKGRQTYSTEMAGIGELRVSEFVMKPFDVTIATPLAQVRASMRSYIEVCAALLLAMLIVSVIIGRRFSRVILEPLIFIRETANRISSDNLSERIPLRGERDELADLADLLNRMFDRLEVSFDQIKRFSADASHELKTPLSLIRLHGEKMLEDTTLSTSAVEAVLVQLDEVARLNQIIEEMLFLSRAEAGAQLLDLKIHSPRQMLENFEQDGIALAEHRGCHFVLDARGDGLVAFEERWLRQVWLNLLTNALNISPAGGTVTLTSRIEGTSWIVIIEDEGPGLPPEHIGRIFDRFSQFGDINQRARGSGLGLAISKSICELHRGTIAAENRTSRSGLRMKVDLPTVETGSATAGFVA